MAATLPSRRTPAKNGLAHLGTAGKVGERKPSAEALQRLARVHATLSAACEAILRATSPADLYRHLCDAIVQGGEYNSACVFLAEPGSTWLQPTAAAGVIANNLPDLRISVDGALAEGRGVVGVAVRTAAPSVSNDVFNDERMRPWHALHQTHTRAAAAVPILRDGRAIGALALSAAEPGVFDDEAVQWIDRTAKSIALALENFERGAERERLAQAWREGEEKYRAVLENMSEGYFEVDLAGNFLFFNDATARMLGYSRDEMVGLNYRRYYDEATAQDVYETYRRIFRSRESVALVEWPYLLKDGGRGIWEQSVQIVLDARGEPIGFRGVARDVTRRRQAEEALRANEEKYRGILESIEDCYYENDLKGNLTLVNPALSRMLGYSEQELIGMNYREYIPPEVAARSYEVFNEVYRTGVPNKAFSWAVIRKDGGIVQTEGSVSLVRNAQGRPIGFRGIMRDVTLRRQTEQALRDSEARFRALTNLSSDWYWEQDAELRFTRMESRHAKQDALREDSLGRRPWELGFEIDGSKGKDSLQTLLGAQRPFRDVVMRRTAANDGMRYLSVSGEPLCAADGSFAGYRGVAKEVTDQKLAEERIRYLATHDSLTGLPNRTMFSEVLNVAIKSAQRYQRNVGVLFIDLDRFKVINDTLGHDAGDQLLKEVASRLKQALRASDVVARLGGDEFVVLLQELGDSSQAAVVARKVLSAVIKPVLVMGKECRVTTSIGIAMYPHDGDDEQSLMKHADMAMYFAKEEGKNNFQFYSKEIRTQSLEKMTLESNLRQAIERNELFLHYQAKVDLKNNAITGVEALLRWDSPVLGSVTPAQFIPVAEESGLIVPIGDWVLRQACRQNVAWQRAGLPPVCIAVNLSPRQFMDEHLLATLADALRESGMAPHHLELEVTESMVMHNIERAIKLLVAIKQMGVRLAIDDFGTGYSSLAQLKRFPIDTLKVDRSFIRDLPTDSEDRALTEAIIAMGKSLSLTIVAEGVETEEQQDFLREHACDQMQGYYFSKPIAPEQFADLLRNHVASV